MSDAKDGRDVVIECQKRQGDRLRAKIKQLEDEREGLIQALLKAIMERPPVSWPALPPSRQWPEYPIPPYHPIYPQYT